MSDKPESECVACDRVWTGLILLGAAVIGFIAADLFTGGQASVWLGNKMRRPLAAVIPIRAEEDGDDQAG